MEITTKEGDVKLSASDAPVSFFKRKAPKSTLRKRPATPPPESDSSGYGSSSGDDAPGKLAKRQKRGLKEDDAAKKQSESLAASFVGSKEKRIESTNDATRSTTYHNEDESQYLARKNNAKSPVVNDGKLYKGQKNYQTFVERRADAPPPATVRGKAGPLKAPTNIRTITYTDYAPDVCKDYKQTGFCGFGDTCKFLHAREDYKAGWELDREWEVSKKQGGQEVEEASDSDPELAAIPFACLICKGSYKNPVVTKCKHYFCETCAITRYKRFPSCKICGSRTDGVFNTAKELQKKLDKKRDRALARQEAEEDNDEGDGIIFEEE